MPPDFPTWFLYMVVGGVALIPGFRWVLGAIGKQIASEILEHITPSIRSVAREEINLAVDEKLQPLYQQLKPNGGTSMHDRLTAVEQAVHTLNLNTARWDPPTEGN